MNAVITFPKRLRILLFLVLILSMVQTPSAAQGGNPVYLPLVTGKAGQPAHTVSSQDLIEKAQATGQLDEETSLLYQVFALYNDPRLPPQYHGNDSQMLDSMVMLHVQEQWSSLSPQTQAILMPFILPPNSSSVSSLQPFGIQAEPTPNPHWPHIEAMGGSALIWYPPTLASGPTLAAGLKTALETRIWAKETGLMGIQPLSDLGSPQQIGPDGALDIYIVNNMPGALGLTIPLQRATPPTGAGCESFPTYIKIAVGALGSDTTKGMVQILAHEFMHSLQFSMHLADACSDYDWLREATATWAMDYAYPQANYEQDYAKDFLDHPELPLEDTSSNHEYGAYLLPFFLTHLGSPELVRTIWDNAHSMNSLAAVDQVAPNTSFQDVWWYFAEMNWNRSPYGQIYQDDKLTYQLKPEGGLPVAVTVPGGESIYTLDAPVDHLSARYYHYKFNDSSASLVTIFNGVNFGLTKQPWTGSDYAIEDGSLNFASQDLDPEQTKGASVTALVKIQGQDWTRELLSGMQRKAYCRDKASQRLEELVIIVSNYEYQDRSYQLQLHDQAPVLWVSNVGCGKWVGTSSYTSVDLGVTETANASGVTYEDFVPDFSNESWYGLTYPELMYKLTAANVTWRISGTDQFGCTHSGSGSYSGYHQDGSVADLILFPGLLSGASYRGLTGFGGGNPDVELTDHVVCPDGFSYNATTIPPEFLETNLENLNTISEDGRTLQGSHTEVDYNGTHTWEWNLSAQNDQ